MAAFSTVATQPTAGLFSSEANVASDDTPSPRFVFPKWANYLLPGLIVIALGGGPYVATLAGLGASAEALNEGYRPDQPVPYSHKLHAGELGIDCRYCHTTVDEESFAAIPPTQTCMNCHQKIRPESEKLALVRKSHETGEPIPWKKVHDLGDYAYFNHSMHVNKGVACVQCHGRVDRMEVVEQKEPLSMGWCLDCHREPEPRLRPRDEVTEMGWHPPADQSREELGKKLAEEYEIPGEDYMTNCSLCHR